MEEPAIDPTERWLDAARVKLHRICGPERGEELLRQALTALELKRLESADDLFTIAGYFVKRGGFLEAVGYALQFQATLHG